MKTFCLLILSFLFLSANAQHGSFCTVLQMGLANGKNGFTSFRGAEEKDTLNYKVKESIFKGSRFISGTITLHEKQPGSNLKVNSMVLNTTPSDSLKDTLPSSTIINSFSLYSHDLHDMCFAEYRLSDLIRLPEDMDSYALYYIYKSTSEIKGEMPVTTFSNSSYIAIRLKKTPGGKMVYREVTFYYVTP